MSNYNIINEMKHSSQNIDTDQIGLQISLGYRIIPSLKADVNFSFNTSHTDDETYYGEETNRMLELKKIVKIKAPLSSTEVGDPIKGQATSIVGGELQLGNTKNESYNVRGNLTYNEMLTENQNLTVSLIGELSSSKYTGFKITKRNYLPDRGMIFDTWTANEWSSMTSWYLSDEARGRLEHNLTRQIGAILSASWAWKNTYVLNGNMRTDWSNKFGDRSNEKFLPIWSVSGRWNIHDNLLYGVSWINTMALKMSFGFQGNMSETESPKLIIQKKGTHEFYKQYYSEIKNFPNPLLGWEKTKTFNVDIEFAFFNHKLVGNLGYYYRHTSDAFMQKEVVVFNGTRQYTVNAGTLINQGFEFDFSFTPINNMINAASSALSASGERRGFRWRFDPQFGSVFNQLLDKLKPKDKIILDHDLKIDDYLNGQVQVAGRPVNTFYSFRFKGLDHNTGMPEFYGAIEKEPMFDKNGNPVMDEHGNQKIVNNHDVYYNMEKEEVWRTKLLTRSGCREPFLQGGISNTFEYNNWVLAFNLAYSLGSKIRLFRMYDNGASLPAPEKNMRRDWAKRWRVPGDEAHTNIPGIVGGAAYLEMNSRWWQNQRYDWQKSRWDMYDYSDLRVASGNYLKFTSLQLRYVVPNRICQKMYMQAAYLSLSGTNLFTICSKKLKGQDPSQSGSTELINISVRPTYSLTLNVTF